MNEKSIAVLIEQYESTFRLGQQAISALAQYFEQNPGRPFTVKAKSSFRLSAQVFGTTVHFATRVHSELHTTEIAVFAEHEFTKGVKHVMSAVIDESGTLQFRNNPVPVAQSAVPIIVGAMLALRNDGVMFADTLAI